MASASASPIFLPLSCTSSLITPPAPVAPSSALPHACNGDGGGQAAVRRSSRNGGSSETLRMDRGTDGWRVGGRRRAGRTRRRLRRVRGGPLPPHRKSDCLARVRTTHFDPQLAISPPTSVMAVCRPRSRLRREVRIPSSHAEPAAMLRAPSVHLLSVGQNTGCKSHSGRSLVAGASPSPNISERTRKAISRLHSSADHEPFFGPKCSSA